MERSIRYNCLIIFLLGFSLLSCKIQKQPDFNNPDQYFKVSMYSIGTGIDHEAENAVVNTIDKYTKKGHYIGYARVQWGREGETDYCFTLQKLDPTVYKEFLGELSSLLKNKQVHITEKDPCEVKQ